MFPVVFLIESGRDSNTKQRKMLIDMDWSDTMVKNCKQKLFRFLCSTDGVTTVEYAVLLVLVVGMMIAALTYVGGETKEMSDIVVNGLSDALEP